MSYQKGCSGCETLGIADPLERAHRLLDLHVESGRYDHWGPLQHAIEEAGNLQLKDGRYTARHRVTEQTQAQPAEPQSTATTQTWCAEHPTPNEVPPLGAPKAAPLYWQSVETEVPAAKVAEEIRDKWYSYDNGLLSEAAEAILSRYRITERP